MAPSAPQGAPIQKVSALSRDQDQGQHLGTMLDHGHLWEAVECRLDLDPGQDKDQGQVPGTVLGQEL